MTIGAAATITAAAPAVLVAAIAVAVAAAADSVAGRVAAAGSPTISTTTCRSEPMTDTDTDIAPGWRVDEGARAETIAQHDFEAIGRDPALTRITDFAAALCDASVALVTVVEEQRQQLVARTGTDLTETPRSVSFCQFAMGGEDVMVVPDATQDPRFVDNALVTGPPHIRFYAGAPIVAPDGVPLGALCVIDDKTRAAGLTPLQRQGLTLLAEAVVQRFDRNRRLLPG